MTSRIGGSVGGGNWKHAHGTAHYGRNFAVKWLKVLTTWHTFNKVYIMLNELQYSDLFAFFFRFDYCLHSTYKMVINVGHILFFLASGA